MSTKRLLLHGLTASLLSALASGIFLEIYKFMTLVNFDKVINWVSLSAACTIGCMLMTLGYWLVYKIRKPRLIGWLNLLIVVLSFASIIGVFTTKLPLDIEFPELFPGLVIPMHFFPALAFMSIFPLFNKN